MSVWNVFWLLVDSDEYFRMKLQWKSVSEEQERRNSRLRDYRSLIGETETTFSFYLSKALEFIRDEKHNNEHIWVKSSC